MKRGCRGGVSIWVRVELFGGYRLMTRSRAGCHPAGWRLQRGGLFPIDRFSFNKKSEADEAAEKLQKYLNL